ncbi:MAG: hypothetical protein WCR31_03975 [Treponema sp.]
MKKTIAILACLLFAAGITFAQDAGTNTTAPAAANTPAPAASTDKTLPSSPDESYNNKGFDDKTMRVIVPENQHTTDKTASVKIEYTPMYDEVRIYYTCMYVTYDKGEAMNTVIACLEDFMKENQYYHYTYLSRDREKYFKNDRGYSMAQYMSYVKFSR